jgi:hypothetical protein
MVGGREWVGVVLLVLSELVLMQNEQQLGHV